MKVTHYKDGNMAIKLDANCGKVRLCQRDDKASCVSVYVDSGYGEGRNFAAIALSAAEAALIGNWLLEKSKSIRDLTNEALGDFAGD